MAKIGKPTVAEKEELHKKELEFVAEMAKGGFKKGTVTTTALKVRPELAPRSAMNWGQKVLKDPEIRKQMQLIEQGGLLKIHQLLDSAIETICDFLTNKEASDKVRLEAAKIVLQRVYGAVPESVTMVKVSMFDGIDTRANLRDDIRQQMDDAVFDVEVTDGSE